MPQVDPEKLAALRRLRAAFGPIEVLEVVEHQPGRGPEPRQAAHGGLVDDEAPTDDG